MLLRTVENYTPFEYFAFEKMAPGRRHADVLVVKATCELHFHPQGKESCNGITLSAAHAPLHLADEHFGPPEQTSLRKSGDTVLFKPLPDLIFSGHVQPPPEYPSRWRAAWRLHGGSLDIGQPLEFSGPYHWRHTLLSGWQLSTPEPVDRLPLRYELAFGGRYAEQGNWIKHAPNPVGCGFLKPARMDREQHYAAPQIEFVSRLRAQPGETARVPALGALPRFWQARRCHAGTYDAAWRREFDSPAGPDYPADFDLRFFQAAHPDAIVPGLLKGGERLRLAGFCGAAVCEGQLPRLRIESLLLGPRRPPSVAVLRLDTLEVDLDAQRLYLAWRLAVPHQLECHTAVLRVIKES